MTDQSEKPTRSGKGWEVDVMRRLLAEQEKRKPEKGQRRPLRLSS